MAASGICDAICNVREDELQEIEDLVTDLTRQLRVAIGVRDALNGKTTFGTFTVQGCGPTCCEDPRLEPPRLLELPPVPSEPPVAKKPGRKPGRKPRQVAELAREPRQPKRPIEATIKTLEVGKMLQRRGAMSKENLAHALGWKFHQVAMVIGRSARHFVHLDDGSIDVTPALAKLL
jgi:hypothetical protein